MHNHDDKYLSRPGYEPGTPRLQAPVDTNEPSGTAFGFITSHYSKKMHLLGLSLPVPMNGVALSIASATVGTIRPEDSGAVFCRKNPSLRTSGHAWGKSPRHAQNHLLGE